ncbi:alkaline ceramidase [Parapedobacter pyrenivorans]|uniref:Alkaline ceramidase n=1 Tax=Parapedobacter pyrenivorans TaxID=1305674 RepID=A0A917HB29_9SPHI|nr:neutral/alkaline non-lysosomal ceramidase N-terminal domain-containing protein [Parapedobacter pyrenivorans]GGG73870.1 alkaline ceramidase [Parapedobacter pyrenivorans]
MLRYFFYCLLALMLSDLFTVAKSAETGWKVGVAKAVITPGETMWMAGFSARTKPAEGKQHELWAKAVVLEDAQGAQAVMVAADILGFTQELSSSVKQELRERFGVSDANIMLNSSHTHSGPVLTGALIDAYSFDAAEQAKVDRYTQWLGECVVQVVADAFMDLEAATLYSGIGVTRFQVNRRKNSAADLHKLTEIKGPSDHAVPVLKVVKNDRIAAVLFAYSCHPTTLDGYEWSGDFPGFAQLELERVYEGAVALFFQGTGGDQNPLPRGSTALARQYGKELAAAVEAVVETDEMKLLQPTLQTTYCEIALPFSPSPSISDLQAVVTSDGNHGYYSRWANRLIGRIQGGETLDTSYPYPVQLWKLGEQLIFGLAGEVVVDYAVGLKEKYGWDAFVFGYNNDVMGYIPTARIIDEGGYEGDSAQRAYGLPAKWDPAIESLIYEACDQLERSLK